MNKSLRNVTIKSKKEIFEKILSFKSLHTNWRGFDSYRLEAKAAANALAVIDAVGERGLKTIGELYPNPNGTLTITWRNEVEEELSLEIGNTAMTYYLVTNSQKPLFFNINQINAAEIKKLVEAINMI